MRSDLKEKFYALCSAKGLTPRQTEVVEQVIRGITNKEVGRALFVTEECIKFHLTSVYKQTGWRNRHHMRYLLYEFTEKETA